MITTTEIHEFISKKIEMHDKVVLELGCGEKKRHPEAIGIDALFYKGVDIVGDIHIVLEQFPDRSVSAVYSYHCFEHLVRLEEIIRQLGRIMEKHAKLFVVVPHFTNPYYYSDSTHRQPFGLYTFCYYSNDNLFSRRCPKYQRKISFQIKKVKLVFKSPLPFYGRFCIKKIFQFFFNMNRYFMEFYEENLCWLIPCYEIQFTLERL